MLQKLPPAEAVKKMDEWEKSCTGRSGLSLGYFDKEMYIKRGHVVREVICLLSNGVECVGYKDRQGRLIATLEEFPERRKTHE